MKISIPGLGGRLQRARKGTGLSQDAVAIKIGVSWMTVHRWERSQRGISEENLDRLCELYDKPLRWFLTLEEGDLEEDRLSKGSTKSSSLSTSAAAANSLSRKLADAHASHLPMIEKVVEDLLDGMKQSDFGR